MMSEPMDHTNKRIATTITRTLRSSNKLNKPIVLRLNNGSDWVVYYYSIKLIIDVSSINTQGQRQLQRVKSFCFALRFFIFAAENKGFISLFNLNLTLLISLNLLTNLLCELLHQNIHEGEISLIWSRSSTGILHHPSLFFFKRLPILAKTWRKKLNIFILKTIAIHLSIVCSDLLYVSGILSWH